MSAPTTPTPARGLLTRRALFQRSGLALGATAAHAFSPGNLRGADATAAPDTGAGYASDPAWIKAKYGPWGGPGVRPLPGPMDAITVRDYAPRSSLVLQESHPLKARFPVIDVHAHTEARTPAAVADWVRTMDAVGIETTIILTGATGEAFDRQTELFRAHPRRFQVFCGLLTTDIEQPDYPARAAAELERCYRAGARGVGELSDKGMGFGGGQLPRPKRLHGDDPRLDPFFRKCAGLKIPVIAHIADHPSCWTPLDVYQERPPQYQHFNLHGKDVPTHAELIASRDGMVARHPQTTFISCHLGNQGHDLGALGQALDRHRNLFLDISARDYEIGRTPRAAAAFLEKYHDRVLFGTDMGRHESMYRAWWRLFETPDEYMPGRVWWRYYGLALPSKVLESLYRGNARKLLNWQA
jgi:predicted TIM-barrel fold metal-dependent hydrolase